ncbi:11029_t:CDS:2 [Funneliformis geosporum]|uniref:7099_t:CDS:1 n=1 Tax=Funneliformis geosporum TaxID=1117311 RepID=A0A9W4SGG0_9GLOM|nr:7099_t:CDS:2 [Funneliformis geosporum]CAI2168749.1 11029_t:CDS:2 [Funneliformis geosporum]
MKALSAGAVISAAMLYRFQHNIEQNTNQIVGKLHNTQIKLDSSLPGNLRDKTLPASIPSKTSNSRPQLPLPSVAQTKHYIHQRFIPTFKSTWNENIISITQKFTNFDFNGAVKSGYESVKSFAEEKVVKKK